ncbi:MAG: hypothetical protein IJP02_01830 [Oscillospiraceae bacterium]|nr:hypothetical protein [Oscillospiraceae bacterium]
MNKQLRIPKDTDCTHIQSIELAGFEHIATTSDEGYFLLPRAQGCGDYGLCFFHKHTEDFDRTLRNLNMPVFGVKTKNRCFVAVATGMPYNLVLRIVLKNGSYSLYPGFEVNGETPYEDFCLELFELTGADADYSGMARCYRKWRTDRGELVSLEQRAKDNPCLDYAAHAPMIRIRCGWKPAPPEVVHQTRENEPPMHVACDFDRVSDILDELKAQGVDRAEICLVGWNVKGHDGRWPEAFPVCEELGGEEKLRRLIRKGQDMGYQITCHTNNTDQYEIADGYDPEHNLVTREGGIAGGAYSGGQTFYMCPEVCWEQAQEMLPRVAELGFRGIHYIDVLSALPLHRCYHPDHPLAYPQSLEYAKKLCALAREQFGGVSSEGGFDFAMPYLDYGLYISREPWGGGLCDRPVPFWQLVYHGTVLSNPYFSTFNSTFKTPEYFLKLLEFGGRPTFYYYSVFLDTAKAWKDRDCTCDTQEQLVDSVARIKKAYDIYCALSGTHMAQMEKHEQVAESVFETTYSDGTVVQVDYANMEYHIRKV